MAKLIKGVNDLVTVRPDLAAEWDYEKNGDLKPEDVTSGSHKKVWWKCKKDHEWEAVIKNRVKGNGCPFCSGRYLVVGINDLKTVNPELSLEWNYEKNGDLKPEDVTANNGKKVWWKCKKGHEWEAVIASRNSGVGCPICSGNKVLEGFNDLKTINPDLASEWDYEKNGDLKPEDFTVGSGKKVWWKCKRGHEWNTSISNRNKGNGCPICSGRKVLSGVNDLATMYPELASEWNYEKNGDLKPDEVLSSIAKKVWWKCKKGHEWYASINYRNQFKHVGCPYCFGRKVLSGFNDLATKYPELAAEWNYEKNDNLRPEDFLPMSDCKVWWICSKGHEYESSISNRVCGTGCPICNESHLEKKTRKYLGLYNLNYDEQIKFEDLKDKTSLSYDFGIYQNEKIFALIECQGSQHYEMAEFFGGKKKFDIQQKHDNLKRNYCKKNHIHLYEIPYWFTDEDIEKLISSIAKMMKDS